MATNFPGGIDTFVNPNATSSLDSPSHAGLHTDMGDAMTAVQTELVNNPYGLVHIETQVFSGVSAVSFSNNVFSANYDIYTIFLYATGSGQSDVGFRLRAAGSDNATSNYVTQNIVFSSTTVSGSRATATSANFAYVEGTTSPVGSRLDVYQPFASTKTYFRSVGVGLFNNAYVGDGAGSFTGSNSFDSLTILSSATLTGKAILYGNKL
jgi:hypothetical protein